MKTSGKTPEASVGAQLYVDVRDNRESKFIKVGSRPTRFFLKERKNELPPDVEETLDEEEVKKHDEKISYEEKDLHPLLAYFAYYNFKFNHDRAIYTKTIPHQKSKKRESMQWMHPDMVGFCFPQEKDDWETEVVELNKEIDKNALRLFSFEIKKSLNEANLRESFFQALSNSSWAHEGYLVALEIDDDYGFRAELQRLTSSFGIGIIQLDPDIDNSYVLFQARSRESLDWETINKLCDKNSVFREFLKNVRSFFKSGKIYKDPFDKIFDLEKVKSYIKEKNIE